MDVRESTGQNLPVSFAFKKKQKEVRNEKLRLFLEKGDFVSQLRQLEEGRRALSTAPSLPKAQQLHLKAKDLQKTIEGADHGHLLKHSEKGCAFAQKMAELVASSEELILTAAYHEKREECMKGMREALDGLKKDPEALGKVLQAIKTLTALHHTYMKKRLSPETQKTLTAQLQADLALAFSPCKTQISLLKGRLSSCLKAVESWTHADRKKLERCKGAEFFDVYRSLSQTAQYEQHLMEQLQTLSRALEIPSPAFAKEQQEIRALCRAAQAQVIRNASQLREGTRLLSRQLSSEQLKEFLLKPLDQAGDSLSRKQALGVVFFLSKQSAYLTKAQERVVGEVREQAVAALAASEQVPEKGYDYLSSLHMEEVHRRLLDRRGPCAPLHAQLTALTIKDEPAFQRLIAKSQEIDHTDLFIEDIHRLQREKRAIDLRLKKLRATVPHETARVSEWSQAARALLEKAKSFDRDLEKIEGEMDREKERMSLDYGNKHKNILVLSRLLKESPGVKVPVPYGLAHEEVLAFLQEQNPRIMEEWQRAATAFASCRKLQDPSVAGPLKRIQEDIIKLFSEKREEMGLPSSFQRWIGNVHRDNHYLMVRSTGDEDGAVANAGGNLSLSYVSPQEEQALSAAGQVVASYFGVDSLQNRLSGGQDPFAHFPKVAVTMQVLIGEPIGGSLSPAHIPASGVMFTRELDFEESEDPRFRFTQISTTLGHGEGVVGHQGIATERIAVVESRATPGEAYIHYDHQRKPERLAPCRTEGGGVTLSKVDNPKERADARSLDPAIVKRLFTLGKEIEGHYKESVDIEFIVENGIIYVVQARPVRRQKAQPTYLDLARLEAAGGDSPISRTLKLKRLVAGRSSALVLKDPKEILRAENLDKALKMMIDEEPPKLIICDGERPDPANSHAVVNLAGKGIPCLYTKDKEGLNRLLKEIGKENRELVVCMQSGALNVWDAGRAKPEDFISSGYVAHPAQVAASLEIPALLADIPLPKKGKMAGDLQELLANVQAATTASQALKALEELEKAPALKQLSQHKVVLMSKLKGRKSDFGEAALVAIDRVQEAVERGLKEMRAAITQERPQRLEQLFHVRVLSNLFGQKPTDTALGRFSVITIDALMTSAERVLAHEEALDFPAQMSHEVLYDEYAPTEALGTQWRTFLLSLERECRSDPETVKSFKEMMLFLKGGGVLPTWLSAFFHQARSGEPPPTAKEAALALISQFQASKKDLQELQGKLAEVRRLKSQLAQFSDPHTFGLAWSNLQKTLSYFTSATSGIVLLLKQGSPLAKVVGSELMREMVQTLDLSIKSMKASTAFSPEEKAKLLKEMLKGSFQLFKCWAKDLLGVSSFGKRYISHSLYVSSSVDDYIDKLEGLLEGMPETAVQLLPTSAFSVRAAILSANTLFERHYPGSLEDIFTLLHQNQEDFLGKWNAQVMVPEQMAFPLKLQNLLKKAESFKMDVGTAHSRTATRTGIMVDLKKITAYYNLPLRNHSATFQVVFDKISGDCALSVQFLGYAGSRWQEIAEFGKLLDKVGGPVLLEKPTVEGDVVSLSWKIKTPPQVDQTFAFLGVLSELTFGLNTQFALSQFLSQQRLHEPLGKYYLRTDNPMLPKYKTFILIEYFFQHLGRPGSQPLLFEIAEQLGFSGLKDLALGKSTLEEVLENNFSNPEFFIPLLRVVPPGMKEKVCQRMADWVQGGKEYEDWPTLFKTMEEEKYPFEPLIQTVLKAYQADDLLFVGFGSVLLSSLVAKKKGLQEIVRVMAEIDSKAEKGSPWKNLASSVFTELFKAPEAYPLLVPHIETFFLENPREAQHAQEMLRKGFGKEEFARVAIAAEKSGDLELQGLAQALRV